MKGLLFFTLITLFPSLSFNFSSNKSNKDFYMDICVNKHLDNILDEYRSEEGFIYCLCWDWCFIRYNEQSYAITTKQCDTNNYIIDSVYTFPTIYPTKDSFKHLKEGMSVYETVRIIGSLVDLMSSSGSPIFRVKIYENNQETGETKLIGFSSENDYKLMTLIFLD